MTSSNSIQALKKAARTKHKHAVLKTKTTLQIMQQQSIPINFESVAKLSGVSKTWLYQQDTLSQKIKAQRDKKGKIQRVIEMKSVIETKNNQIKTLRAKNKALQTKLKDLRQQLEVVYGEFYKLKQNNTN